MEEADFKLKERIKELNCLYALSKVAWEAENDLSAIVSKTLEILPRAMQHHLLAEVSITINGNTHTTPQFKKCKYFIDSPLTIGRKKYGVIKLGYRPNPKSDVKPTFLPEEKKLLHAVARELSLFVKRASIEDDKEKLKIQLQHVDRLAFVGELSAGIAHELNEPLGRILGFAQLIKKAGNLGDQQNEDIERIVKASLYTREIIKKLMIFSRQMPRQLTDINLNQVIENTLYFVDVRFQSKGIKISMRLDQTLSPIQADEVQVTQVLVNLITNAVHAISTGGEITISTKDSGNQVRLTVKDTGTGMTKEIKDKIFDPFFTTKPIGYGTGLGLSVVKGIIDSHEGNISVQTTPGKGSIFQIVLPKKQKHI